jgi:hypothetical protein
VSASTLLRRGDAFAVKTEQGDQVNAGLVHGLFRGGREHDSFGGSPKEQVCGVRVGGDSRDELRILGTTLEVGVSRPEKSSVFETGSAKPSERRDPR